MMAMPSPFPSNPTHTPAPTTLEAFALLSVEFTNLPQAIEQHAGREDYVARAWLELLQVRAREFGAQLERVNQHRAFLLFGQEPTVTDSLEAALQLAQQLVSFPIQIFDSRFEVRMGLALEETNNRNPLSAVTERSLAQTGHLVLARWLAERVGLRRYPFAQCLSPADSQHPGSPVEGFLQIDFNPLPVAQPGSNGYAVAPSIPSAPTAPLSQDSWLESPAGPLMAASAAAAAAVVPQPTHLPPPPPDTARPVQPLAPGSLQPLSAAARFGSVLPTSVPHGDASAFAPSPASLARIEQAPRRLGQVYTPSDQPTLQDAPQGHFPAQAPASSAHDHPLGPNMATSPLHAAAAAATDFPPSEASFYQADQPYAPTMAMPLHSPPLAQAPQPEWQPSLPIAPHESPLVAAAHYSEPVQPVVASPPPSVGSFPAVTLFDSHHPPALPVEQATPSLVRLKHPDEPITSESTPYLQVLPRLTSWLQSFYLQGTRQGKLLVLEGPTGVGKTTLLQMARLHLDPAPPEPTPNPDGTVPPAAEPPFLWVQGGPLHQGNGPSPYPLELWHHAIRSLFNLPLEGVPLTYAQQHIEGVLSQVAQQETVAPDTWAFWQDWFGLTGQPPQWPEAMQQPANRCAHHWRHLLGQLAAIKPLILVLDNLDHADEASQALLLELLQSGLLAEAPIALVITKQANTVFEGELAQALAHSSVATTVAIAPLTEQEVVVFLDQGALAGQANHLPNALVQQLVHASQGLPLLLEEYLRYLTQQGLLAPDEAVGGALKPTSYEGLGQVQLPASLPVLLQQRAHGLSDTARQLVQVASVLGERFAPSTLMGLCQLEEGPFQDALGQLWEQGWIVPDVANDLAFRHRALAQYFYQGTPDSMREQLHQLVYQSLSAGYSEPTLLSPALLAHHGALGQLVPQWHAAQHQAGLHAALVGSVVGANSCLLPLAHRLGAVPALADEYHQVLGQLVALNQTAQPELALAVMERLVAEAGPACDTHTLRQLANLYEWNGRFTEANRTLTVALQANEQRPALPVDEQLTLALHFSDLLLQQGHIGQAHEVLQHRVKPLLTQAQTTLAFETLAPLRVQAFLQQFQVALAHDVQQLPDAGQVAQANEWIAQTGDHHARLGLMLLQAKAACVAGQFGSAHQQLNEVLPLIEALPDPAYYLGQWGLIAAQCHVDRGDWTNASLIVPNTQVQAEAARDYNTVLMAQVLEAVLLSQQASNQAKAGPLLDQVMAMAHQVGLVTPALRAMRWKASLLAAHNQASDAMALGETGLAQATTAPVSQTLEAFELVMVTGQALLQLGDVGATSALLKHYWPAITASKNVPLIAQAAWLVAGLHYGSAAQVAPAAREHQMMQGKRYVERAVSLWHGLGNAYQRSKVEAAHRQTLIGLEF